MSEEPKIISNLKSKELKGGLIIGDQNYKLEALDIEKVGVKKSDDRSKT